MTQEEALKFLKLGHNIYLTGAAGSGKTYTLNQYIKFLKEKGMAVGITASTGIAATHLNGMTIHSWTGIGIKDRLTSEDISDLRRRMYLRVRIQNAKALIIDEISMLHAHRLDMVDQVCRAIRKNELPFGGLQVIMCGDFFQLPPVSKGADGEDSFAWKSNIWQAMNLKICYLKEQHRQSDNEFLNLLNEIRNNSVSEDSLDSLTKRYNQEVKGITKPTRLYTHNADVDSINNMELAKLEEKPVVYNMAIKGEGKLVEILKNSCLAPEYLILKVNALVMFVKNNFDKGYVNGTLGKIIGFDSNRYPIVLTTNGVEIIASPESWIIEYENVVKAEINQIPLRLAWAITVHKSQGMSLDAAEIDLSKSFVPGQGYVALSRIRTLAGMKLIGLNDMALKVNQEVFELDQKLQEQSIQDVLLLKNSILESKESKNISKRLLKKAKEIFKS